MTIERSFRETLGMPEPKLTVTREAGKGTCVLTALVDGRQTERVTTSSVKSILDYLSDQHPGEPVKWRLLPPAWAKEVA